MKIHFNQHRWMFPLIQNKKGNFDKYNLTIEILLII